MPVDLDRKVYCLLGLPFDAVDMAAAVARVRSATVGGKPCFLSTPNLNFLIACRDDAEFRDSVINSDLSIADGMPLVWIARLLDLPIRRRVAGSSLFEELQQDAEGPLSVFFFGGAPGVAERACERLNAESRGLCCVGYECPGFGSVDDMSSAETIDRINSSGADFVVVALGARKGQAWIESNRHRLAAPVVSHLGAVINFVAGSVSRSPAWMQRRGLEWLWRIREEPGLWRRYARDGLGLLRLLATRVLPHAWFLRRQRIGEDDMAAASVELACRNDVALVACRGHWSAGNIERLRPVLRQAAAGGKNIEVGFRETESIDSAVIGLLMLAYGLQRRRGRHFMLSGVSPELQKVLYWHCAEFLVQDRPDPRICQETETLPQPAQHVPARK